MRLEITHRWRIKKWVYPGGIPNFREKETAKDSKEWQVSLGENQESGVKKVKKIMYFTKEDMTKLVWCLEG